MALDLKIGSLNSCNLLPLLSIFQHIYHKEWMKVESLSFLNVHVDADAQQIMALNSWGLVGRKLQHSFDAKTMSNP